jgi:hypothetical protein
VARPASRLARRSPPPGRAHLHPYTHRHTQGGGK